MWDKKTIRTYVTSDFKEWLQQTALNKGTTEAELLRWLIGCGLSVTGLDEYPEM